jgi:hypothetical protein
MKKLFIIFPFMVLGKTFASSWDKSNDPRYFNPVIKQKVVLKLDELPLKGELKDKRFGWSESYWPSNLGGIAYRWNHPDPQPFGYKLLSKKELLKMSQEEMSTLSPAELYDIAMGDYQYSLTKKVLKTYSSLDLWWEGICHGWSLAATNYPEPDKNVITNKDGISVPFGSSDVKGLLSMHDAFNSKGFYVRIGDRCAVEGKVPGEERPEDGEISFPSVKEAQRRECSDVNAGAFHVVLTSLIGLNSQGLVADVDRFNDVWNQPVTSYESEIVGEIPLTAMDIKNNIHKKVQIKTQMIYGDELEFYTPELEAEGVVGFVSKNPVTGTSVQMFNSKQYEYILELNQKGEITGGEWVSETRPDMLWVKAKDQKFLNGRFPLEGLNLIYKAVKLN